MQKYSWECGQCWSAIDLSGVKSLMKVNSQPGVVSNSSASTGISGKPLSLPCWHEFYGLKLGRSCLCCPYQCGFIFIPVPLSPQTVFFLSHPLALALINVASSSPMKIRKAVGKAVKCGYVVYAVSYSVQVDPLRISVLTTFCCQKRILCECWEIYYIVLWV